MALLDGSPPEPVATGMPPDILLLLGDRSTLARRPAFHIEVSDDPAYRRLRRQAFVDDQKLFPGTDEDERDADPRTFALIARDERGTVLGGVRLGPAGDGPDIGWWAGSRLVVAPAARGRSGVAAALVRAAAAHAEAAGALRFDATVRTRAEPLFRRLGWQRIRPVTVAGAPHVLMRHPIGRIEALARQAKAALGSLLDGIAAPAGFAGDDGAPVPGSDLVAACDAIVPSMVDRDPEWAGWCAVLVNVNDLTAMGAAPVGLLDALAARDAAQAGQIMAGLRRAARAWDVPILGGHTQLGVPAALSVTALGRAAHPVPGGGGRPGHQVRLTADLGGGWRPGYQGRQWDSTSLRRTDDLRVMARAIGRARPAAAKDVSMAGVAGTLGMLAEASGCRAVLDVAAVPRPAGAAMGDWLTCFPGYAMLTTAGPGHSVVDAGPARTAVCGELTDGHGVGLRWPDGEITPAVGATVTGMGRA